MSVAYVNKVLAYAVNMIAVAYQTPSRFLGFMPTSPPSTTREQATLMGQALKALRLRLKIKQGAAADAMGITRTTWQNYENGRAIILRTDLQDKLAAALGSDREELLVQLAALTPHGARRHQGVGESGPRVFEGDPNTKHAVFPLAGGDVVINYPADLDAEGFEELKDYLDLFFKNRSRRD